jgi:hypothetical protein
MRDDRVVSAWKRMSTSRPAAFPPIAECGFLSDCDVTALLAPSGSVEWMCLPPMQVPVSAPIW